MLVFGHAAAGYLIVYLLMKIFHPTLLTDNQVNLLYIIGIIASLIPDLDIYLFFYKHKSIKLQRDDSHRKYFSHTVLFWLVISIIVFFAMGTFFGLYVSIVIFLSTMCHLLFDSIEYGVMWLWPFSNKQYCLHKVPKETKHMQELKSNADYYYQFFTQIYFRNWTFYLEILVLLAWLLAYLRII